MPVPKSRKAASGKRGPGRPRKGLVKVTLSLRPPQVAALRAFALQQQAFAPKRIDLSEAVRAFLDTPLAKKVLDDSLNALWTQVRTLLDRDEYAGLPDATRLMFEIRRGETVPPIDPAGVSPRIADALLQADSLFDPDSRARGSDAPAQLRRKTKNRRRRNKD